MSEKPDILVVEPWYGEQMKESAEHFTLHRMDKADDKDAFLASVADKIVGIGSNNKASAEIINKLPNLKVIANFGVGFDGIDVEAAKARGVPVSNTPNVLNDEVASFAVGLMLATLRRIPQADAYVRAGTWEVEKLMAFTQTATNLKVGILGLGGIGLEIAKRLEPFKYDISYHTRSKRDVAYTYYDSVLEMAKNVSVLIAIVPGGPATRHMVNREVMEALGPSGALINVARGSVVDEEALVEVLKEGKLGAAGLDVFEKEPSVPDALKQMTENVILQPHQASATHETRMAMARLLMNNLIEGVAGRPLITPVY